MPFNDRRIRAPRVKFEGPLAVRAMAIDGTWCRKCRLIDVSNTGARIELTGPVADLTEFFLLLTTFGDPVFRRCTREWVEGTLMGVSFNKNTIQDKSMADLRREARLV
jgi:hypothetical protein